MHGRNSLAPYSALSRTRPHIVRERVVMPPTKSACSSRRRSYMALSTYAAEGLSSRLGSSSELDLVDERRSNGSGMLDGHGGLIPAIRRRWHRMLQECFDTVLRGGNPRTRSSARPALLTHLHRTGGTHADTAAAVQSSMARIHLSKAIRNSFGVASGVIHALPVLLRDSQIIRPFLWSSICSRAIHIAQVARPARALADQDEAIKVRAASLNR